MGKNYGLDANQLLLENTWNIRNGPKMNVRNGM